MGRTLDALKQAGARKSQPSSVRKIVAATTPPVKAASTLTRPDYRAAVAVPTQRRPPATAETVPSTPAPLVSYAYEPNDLPFIEIGGKNMPVEGSADVLACPVTAYAVSRNAVAQSPVVPGVVVTSLQTVPCVTEPPAPHTLLFRPEPVQQRQEVQAAQVVQTIQTPPDLAAELITWHDPEHPVSQQYRDLLAGLRATLTNDPPHVLVFFAIRTGVGASLAVTNLAITAARQGNLQVALVAGNSHSPTLAHYLNLTDGPGVFEVINEQITLEQAIQPTRIERLWALSAGIGSRPGTGSILRGTTLLQLQQHFDLVLVDGPIWQAEDDGTSICSAADAVFLLAPQADADTQTTECCLQAIRQKTQNLRGLLLT